MKKHIKAMIKKSKENPDTQITAFILEGFAEQGFEIVSKKDLKKTKKTIKRLHSQINELVHDNWQIQMRLYDQGLATINPENTNVYNSSRAEVNPITTQAETAGLRQGAEANEQESISAIMDSLDAHINHITKILDRAELTRIEFELNEMDRMLDEPNAGIEDTASAEAIQCYLKHLQAEPGTTPLQARLLALHEIAQTVPETGYDHYWIDVYEYLRTMQFTL